MVVSRKKRRKTKTQRSAKMFLNIPKFSIDLNIFSLAVRVCIKCMQPHEYRVFSASLFLILVFQGYESAIVLIDNVSRTLA